MKPTLFFSSSGLSVLYDYVPVTEDELEIFEGTEIEILSTADPNWFRGCYEGREGYVPSNYLQILDAVEIAPPSAVSWSDRVGAQVASQFSPIENRRQEAIFELINTEEIFVLDMQMIANVFITPLRESGFLSEEESIIIFSNLPDLISLSLKFLADLKKLQETENHVIRSIGPFLKQKVSQLQPTRNLSAPHHNSPFSFPPFFSFLFSFLFFSSEISIA